MAEVKFKRKSTSEIQNLPVDDGSFIVDYESGNMYTDYGSNRIGLGGGVVVHDTYSESTAEPYSANYVNDATRVNDTYSEETTHGYSANYINSNSASYNNFESTDQVITGETQITGMSLTITTKKPKVLVMFTIPVKTSGDGSPFVRLMLDSTQKAQYTTNQSSLMLMTHSIVLTNVTAGEHTISIRATRSNATSITIPAYITKSLTVIEL